MPICKIYVDSSRPQGKGEDFVYYCQLSISCPMNCKAVSVECLAPNTFFTVDSSRCYLYVCDYAVGDGTYVTDESATIATGNYSGFDPATAIQTALNEARSLSTSYAVPHNSQTRKLSFQKPTTDHFALQSREQLIADKSWAGVSFGTEPRDANSVIGFDEGAAYVAGALQCQSMAQSLPFQNVYICNSDFGLPGQSMSSAGESHILHKVPEDQHWDNMLHSQHATDTDDIDVRGQRLEVLSVSVRDSNGRLCDLQGQHVSLTIQIIAPLELNFVQRKRRGSTRGQHHPCGAARGGTHKRLKSCCSLPSSDRGEGHPGAKTNQKSCPWSRRQSQSHQRSQTSRRSQLPNRESGRRGVRLNRNILNRGSRRPTGGEGLRHRPRTWPL